MSFSVDCLPGKLLISSPDLADMDVADGIGVHSHALSIRSHRGTQGVFPEFQPMRVSEEPDCIDLFMLNPIVTSLHLRSPVHVVSPLIFYSADKELRSLKRPLASVPPSIYGRLPSVEYFLPIL